MSFASALALLVGVLVAVPLLAHLLRRRRTDVIDFAPARLVPAAPPLAKRRSRLEDRALFALRALAVVALALLGATPLVRCSHLSVGRHGGGSLGLVLVVDDSLSMRARVGGRERFDRAMGGARDVLSSARDGDAVAVVAAGAPARVLLAATGDLASAARALDALHPSDRGTDLDAALTLAASLAGSMPQTDRRVVLLSDLADGHPAGRPVGEGLGVPLWVPLPDLRGRAPDCALVRADRRAAFVHARVACGAASDGAGRSVEILAAGRVVASVPLAEKPAQDVDVSLPAATEAALEARLTGSDALASDDRAPIVAESGPLAIAVVSDQTQSGVATGGPPPVEQALAALDESVVVRPLPVVPDHADELTPFGAVVLDDPPGLTPEARGAFKTWLARGGVGLMFLGPRAGGAILGAAFDPFVPGPVRWVSPAPGGAAPASGGAFGWQAGSLDDLHAKGRALLETRAAEGATVLARWPDGSPFALSRPVDRGVAFTLVLSAGAEASDLPLRPAFLGLLDGFVETARAHGGERRSTVGHPWVLHVGGPVTVAGPAGPVPVREGPEGRVVVPDLAGAYSVRTSDGSETRVAEVAESEVDLTPRPVPEGATGEALGTSHARVDVSPYVAFVLLIVVAGEAFFRLRQIPARAAV